MIDLTGIILTHNEQHHIVACIESLQQVTDDIVVFDSFSTDNTVTLAETAGARVIQHPFENYAAQRNAALEAVTSDWVFFLDADERVTEALAQEIGNKKMQPERGWWLPRHNYIFGKLTNAAGWWPDYQLRLLHRESAHYDPTVPVHEVVILEGRAGFLENPAIHYNYESLNQFISKQRQYAVFEAQRRYREGLRPKIYSFVWLPIKHFYWRYISKRGYTLGWHGLFLSVLMAWFEALAWIKVEALWQRSA